MRNFLLISATSLFLAAPSLSYAACTITDEKTEQELSKVQGISSGDFGDVRRDVRALRSAATILQRYGKDEACQQVVATMSDLLRNPKASLEMRNKSMTSVQSGASQDQSTQAPASSTEQLASTDGPAASTTQEQAPADSQTSTTAQQPAATNNQATAPEQPATTNNQSTEQPAVPAPETKTDPQTTGSTTPATSTDAGPMTMDQRRTTSVPFMEQKNPMSSADLIGTDVYGTENDSIGEIEDVIVSPDHKPSYALISYGGFLGLGENQAAVPVAALRISPDKYVFLPMTADQLKAAPQLQRGTADWWTNENFRAQNDEYYAKLN